MFIKINNVELVFNAVPFYFRSASSLDVVSSTGNLSSNNNNESIYKAPCIRVLKPAERR